MSQNQVYVARISIHDEGTRAFPFQLAPGETKEEVALEIANDFAGQVEEITTIEDYIASEGMMELCTA